MKVDLLRQLDEWGSHLEENIDHVSADEVLDRVPKLWGEAEVRAPRSKLRRTVRLAGAAAVVVTVIGVAVPQFFGADIRVSGGSLSERVSAFITGESEDNTATTAAATSAAPDTTAAAATTLPPEASFQDQSQRGAVSVQAPTTTAPTTTQPPTSTTVPGAGNNPANLGRAVIFVGDLAIDTTDVSSAVAQARAIVESRGGFVSGQELGGQATVMSLKVPAEFFQDTVDRVSALGTVRTARLTSEDVTDRIVDLESQITTSETSVARLQELLADADTINTIARLESELLDRETRLERLRGQLRTLQDQVALSTIVVTFREFVPTPDLVVAVTVHAVEAAGGEECFTSQGPFPTEGQAYVLCVDLTNTGNLDLTEIEIGGPSDLVGALATVTGDRIAVLTPGERTVLWTSSISTETVQDEITVRAVPLGVDGEALVERIVDRRRPLVVTLVEEPEPVPEPEPEPDGLPSLGDALSAGWTVVTTAGNALGVAFAFALPLLWIPAIALLVFWRRRRSG